MMDDGDDLSDHSEDERLLRADVDDMSDGDDDGVPPAKRARVDAVAATWMRRAAPDDAVALRAARDDENARRRRAARRRGVRRRRSRCRSLPCDPPATPWVKRRTHGPPKVSPPAPARAALGAPAPRRRRRRRAARVPCGEETPFFGRGLDVRSGAARQPAPVPYFGVGRTHRAAAPAPGRVVETLRGVAGRAIFALPLDPEKNALGAWFSGHVVDAATGRQFQVVGTEEPCPAGCLCAKVDLFSLTFTDPRLRRRATALVEATGGDYLRLAPADAAGCAFEAESLIAERARADALLAKFFPRLLADATARGTEVLLNVGTVACAQLLFSEIPS
ncbi:hypothetical protein SO694_00029345 [Aureococcus anophagefferens]|uniref:Uncharacterized protein n=1 Tax=Aureococcus anophagefferens TaxID=44056 RepID=A0ABR1FVU1_AURAN